MNEEKAAADIELTESDLLGMIHISAAEAENMVDKVFFTSSLDFAAQTITLSLPDGKSELTLPNREWAEWFVECISRDIQELYGKR